MRVKRPLPYANDKDREFTVAEAVSYAVTPAPYDYPGTIERTQAICDNQTEVLGRLIEALVERGSLGRDDVCAILGYGWEPVS